MGVVVILMNIALMFVHENSFTERILSQKKTDEIIKNKLGNNNFLTKFYLGYQAL